ncbi:MAG TPA: carboxypeptidase regulatory-like domain-containing protein [Verrucomicrobiae bacterium]|nr:carboxypeptidase regulatory-like domain-containing protein [Verrucomicrobiae bacterium]
MNYESRALKFATRVDYGAMHDFIVYIEGPVGTNKLVAPGKPVQVLTVRQVNQKHATFEPHIMPIVVGTTVEWPNNDDIYHNVFSYSEVKPFDLDLYKAPTVKKVLFDKPGRVDVFCSIHSSMSCVVLVLENPYFARTDSKDVYTIKDVPAGTYHLKAWHERLPAQSREIVVPEKGEVKADFTLGITGLPKL